MRSIYIATIPGVMLGIEWDYINKFVVLDLLIIRFVIDYYPEREMPEAEEE